MRWLPLILVLASCGAPTAPTVAVPVSTPSERPRPVYSFERWSANVPVRHCASADFDPGVIAYVAAEMGRASGLPPQTSGPCSVEWTVEDWEGNGAAYCERKYDGLAITHAKIVFKRRAYQRGVDDARTALHEAGHALGLVHSETRRDLMYPTPVVDGFSDSELAHLSAMYR